MNVCPRTPGIILRNIGKTIKLRSASANVAVVEIVVLKTTQIKPLTGIENPMEIMI